MWVVALDLLQFVRSNRFPAGQAYSRSLPCKAYTKENIMNNFFFFWERRDTEGKIMFKEVYNSRLQNRKETFFFSVANDL